MCLHDHDHDGYHLMTAFWYRDFLLSAKLNVVGSAREHLRERKMMEETIKREEEEAAMAMAAANLRTTKAKAKAKVGGKGKKKGKKGGKRGGGGGGSATKANNGRVGVGGHPKMGAAGGEADAAQSATPDISQTSGEEDDEDTVEFLLTHVERNLCRGIVRVSTYSAFHTQRRIVCSAHLSILTN